MRRLIVLASECLRGTGTGRPVRRRSGRSPVLRPRRLRRQPAPLLYAGLAIVAPVPGLYPGLGGYLLARLCPGQFPTADRPVERAGTGTDRLVGPDLFGLLLQPAALRQQIKPCLEGPNAALVFPNLARNRQHRRWTIRSGASCSMATSRLAAGVAEVAWL